jgi:LacI family transcriptional regulator
VATIVDIAKRAGVSTSTVSHVLNGTRRVLPATAQQVQAAIDELGYKPNDLARSLARSYSATVGLAISAISNPYFNDIIQAMQRECDAAGLMVFLCDTEDDPEREFDVVRALQQRRVDGILLAAAPDPAGRTLAYLASNNIPCVLVDRLSSPAFDGIGVENRASTAQLVSHILGHGHTRIGYVPGHPGFDTTLERLDGYRSALQAAGVPVDESLIAPPTSDRTHATQATAALLSRPDRPTALMTGNNHATIGAVRAIRQAGLRIPEDIALAGFDDFDWAGDFEPQLTVIAQPVAEIGRLAAARLVARIRSPETPSQHIRLAGRLMVRASCGCNPRPDRPRIEPRSGNVNDAPAAARYDMAQ